MERKIPLKDYPKRSKKQIKIIKNTFDTGEPELHLSEHPNTEKIDDGNLTFKHESFSCEGENSPY
jgi:hypothetical protein